VSTGTSQQISPSSPGVSRTVLLTSTSFVSNSRRLESSRSRTRRPSHSPKKEASKSSKPKEDCPKTCSQNEDCSKALKCKGESLPNNDKVRSYSYKITNEDAPATAPVVTNDGTVVGTIHIPSGAFPKGTVLVITRLTREVPSENEERCSTQTQVSFGFDIFAHPPDNEDKTVQPKKPIKIQLATERKLVDSKSDDDELCLGYQKDKGDEWRCESEAKKVSAPGKGKPADKDKYEYFKGSTSHFTSFAMLLLGPTKVNGCKPTRWVAHISVALGIILFFVLFVILSIFWRRLDNFVRGRKGRTLAEIEKELKHSNLNVPS
jgi:hypothetical protein